MSDITAVIPTWANARMAKGCVVNLQKYYPNMPILIIDDHTTKDDWSLFKPFYNRIAYWAEKKYDPDWEKLKDIPGTRLIRLDYHLGDGSCLDRAVDEVQTPLMLTVDSDMRILKTGLIEKELEDMNSDPGNIYGVGPSRIEHNWVKVEGPPYAWLKPIFSLYLLEALRFYKFTFRNYTNPVGAWEGTACFLHKQLTSPDKYMKPKVYKSILYSQFGDQDVGAKWLGEYIWELKVADPNDPNHIHVKKWEELIDG